VARLAALSETAFEKRLAKNEHANTAPTGFELWVAAKLCWQVFG